jgi:hypothetical protein
MLVSYWAALWKARQMATRCGLPSFAGLALFIAGSAAMAQERPQLVPVKDVDISYKISRPNQPAIIERRRWLAAENLERVDGPDKSTTIFDRNKGEIILLNTAKRTFRKLEGKGRRPPEPGAGVVLRRGGDVVIAGLHCAEWTWTEDTEIHTVCVTPEGALLRLVIDGRAIIEARSVHFAQQKAELFQVPPNYSPALAPEGAPEP